MRILVKTVISSSFDVPEGVTLERIRQLTLAHLSVSDEQAEEVILLQGDAISEVFYGDQQTHLQSVEHSVSEVFVEAPAAE